MVVSYYKKYNEDPDGFKLEIELPDEPWYSPEVLAGVLAGKKIDHSRIKTWNDAKILQLGWVFDINFIPTLKRLKQRNLLEQMFDYLPENAEMEKLKIHITNYLESRINNR